MREDEVDLIADQSVHQIVRRTDPNVEADVRMLGVELCDLFIETLERLTISPILRTGILTGVLGGYTTFSTFAMESLLLVEQGEPVKALLYLIISPTLGFFCAFAGAYIALNL